MHSLGKTLCPASFCTPKPNLPVTPDMSGEGNGNPLQWDSCLANTMDRGAWRATVHGVARVGHDLVTKPPPPPLIKNKYMPTENVSTVSVTEDTQVTLYLILNLSAEQDDVNYMTVVYYEKRL